MRATEGAPPPRFYAADAGDDGDDGRALPATVRAALNLLGATATPHEPCVVSRARVAVDAVHGACLHVPAVGADADAGGGLPPAASGFRTACR